MRITLIEFIDGCLFSGSWIGSSALVETYPTTEVGPTIAEDR